MSFRVRQLVEWDVMSVDIMEGACYLWPPFDMISFARHPSVHRDLNVGGDWFSVAREDKDSKHLWWTRISKASEKSNHPFMSPTFKFGAFNHLIPL